MSATKPLADILKVVSTATSLSGLSMLCVNSSGILSKSCQICPIPETPYCEDADLATRGWTRTKTSTLNLPASGNGGFLLTLQYDGVARTQIFFAWHPGIYTRIHTSGASVDRWKDWMKVSLIAV